MIVRIKVSNRWPVQFGVGCPTCELCGGELDIKATMIGCRSCGTVWGRCNGAWVEVSEGTT